jgi:Arc/MetJ family transcription regulator
VTNRVYFVTPWMCMLCRVKKRTNMNVDMELVAKVAKILETKTTTATVHGAMDEVVKLERRRQLVRDNLEGLTPELLEEMDRPDHDLSDFHD